ncbi:MAG TPA: lipid II flippase MurJ [Pedobacter sp.]|nr:lipid II flippase MurJ [Pedobacter sp.]
MTLSLSAKYFGVSIQRDVWLLAFNCIVVLDLAIWGPLNETFRAKFIFFREENGEDEALKRARSVLIFTNVITVVIVAFLILMPELLAGFIAPGLKGAELAFLLFMIQVIAPSFLFNQIGQILISILNAYNSIYIPEISGFISGIINLAMIILLAPVIGIYALACSYYLGLLLLIVLLVIQVKKMKINLFSQMTAVKLSDAMPFVLFALPFFLPYFAGQIANIVEKSIASTMGTGVVSVLDYARKFSDILLGVLSSVLTTILVPALSVRFAQKDHTGFFQEFRQMYQGGLLLLAGITAMFTACPGAFVAILYGQGSINTATLTQISTLTTLYSWSAVAVFLYAIIGMSLIASKKGKIYALYGIVAQLVMVALNLLFYKKLGTYIFPLSLLAAHFMAVILIFSHLPQRKSLALITLKYLLLLVLVTTLLYGINVSFIKLSSPFLSLLANGSLFLFLMLSLIFVFRLDEGLALRRLYQTLARPQIK